jgi:hypothetical protein
MTEESNNGQSNKRPSRSGQQIAKDNVRSVATYVEGLKERGERLPGRKGQPNWTAIALACGFARGVFYDNDEARAVIEQAITDEKLKPEPTDEPKAPAEHGRAAHTQKKLEGTERDKRRLEEQLAVKNTEIEELRRSKKELEEKLRRFTAFEEVMVTSGRRYIP